MAKITLAEFFKLNPAALQFWSPLNDNEMLAKTLGSNTPAQWLCPKCKQTSPMPIVRKVKNLESCGVCSGSRVVAGVNDLAILHPQLELEWSPHNKKSPSDVTASSGYKAEWVCSSNPDHVWSTAVFNRTSKGSKHQKGCPHCAHAERTYTRTKDLLLPDGKDVPAVIKDWYRGPVSNHSSSFTVNSTVLCAWECSKSGHTWEAPARTVYKSPQCSQCEMEKKSLATVRPDVAISWSKRNLIGPELVTTGSAFRAWWTCEQGHEWDAYVYAKCSAQGAGCPRCVGQVSMGESRIADFVKSLGLDIIEGGRKIIAPYELDIFIPMKRIAIEYNGLFWHSESAGRDRSYHANKWSMCKENDIQLITVWEDDWERNPQLIQKMIAHKLGLSAQKKVYARNCQLRHVSYSDADLFLNQHHIQGGATGSHYLALFENDKMVAVSVWEVRSQAIYLHRYATSQQVLGGLGKLLKYAKREIAHKMPAVRQVVTFADKMISDGSMYETLGFRNDKELRADYCYLYKNKRMHKFNFRKSRFSKDPALQFDPSMSERELAELNKIPRIWDAGKIRFVLDI